MLSYIDNLLNRITMYKLLLYYLIALILIGIAIVCRNITLQCRRTDSFNFNPSHSLLGS